jgi:hypothetical protein
MSNKSHFDKINSTKYDINIKVPIGTNGKMKQKSWRISALIALIVGMVAASMPVIADEGCEPEPPGGSTTQ